MPEGAGGAAGGADDGPEAGSDLVFDPLPGGDPPDPVLATDHYADRDQVTGGLAAVDDGLSTGWLFFAPATVAVEGSSDLRVEVTGPGEKRVETVEVTDDRAYLVLDLGWRASGPFGGSVAVVSPDHDREFDVVPTALPCGDDPAELRAVVAVPPGHTVERGSPLARVVPVDDRYAAATEAMTDREEADLEQELRQRSDSPDEYPGRRPEPSFGIRQE